MAKGNELADAMVKAIGLEATRTLVRAYGGKRIKVPNGRGRPGSFSAWLDENIGLEAARCFRAAFGGEDIGVPKLYAQAIAARNRIIIGEYDGGKSMHDLVRDHDLTERQIRNILNSPVGDDSFDMRAVDDRQMGLF